MKKTVKKRESLILPFALVLTLILILSACGAKNNADQNSDENGQANLEDADWDEVEKIEDIGETEDLNKISESAAETESLCAVAYCGSRGGYADALDAFEHLRLSEKYPDLAKDISVYDTGGDEFYILAPSANAVSVTIEGYGMDDEGNAGPDGEIFYVGDGSPVVLLCNLSDLIPDTQVTVEDKDGNQLIFSPSLSLEDGKLYAPGTVDFTDYEWAALN